MVESGLPLKMSLNYLEFDSGFESRRDFFFFLTLKISLHSSSGLSLALKKEKSR